ncbi:uncharacterized protein TNCT_87951 [Trichonephila clavata]|uniref:Uncharacterized protein n=1 Tax=Trichonephila clavata TaxID=2740835 RepID=A0A8X6LW49_TRICU|nr:uncharacterized protein TNCT_87951 [Trichonephila clavata]
MYCTNSINIVGPNGDSNNKLLDCPDNQQWSSTADVVFFIKSLKCALEKSEVSDGNGNRTNHPHEGIDQETLLFLSKWLRNELLSRTSQVLYFKVFSFSLPWWCSYYLTVEAFKVSFFRKKNIPYKNLHVENGGCHSYIKFSSHHEIC